MTTKKLDAEQANYLADVVQLGINDLEEGIQHDNHRKAEGWITDAEHDKRVCYAEGLIETAKAALRQVREGFVSHDPNNFGMAWNSHTQSYEEV